ncbi:MAG TPA: hypothetical protein VEF04_20485 [Blastocatellia bacterium]|nr:hypothetical protein [Blastocatellia bacterium]
MKLRSIILICISLCLFSVGLFAQAKPIFKQTSEGELSALKVFSPTPKEVARVKANGDLIVYDQVRPSLLAQAIRTSQAIKDQQKQEALAKPETIPLTEEETKQAMQLAYGEQMAEANLKQAGANATDAPVQAQAATEALANLKLASLQHQFFQSQRKLWFSEIRHKYACSKCTLSEDFKSLVRPQPEPIQKK